MSRMYQGDLEHTDAKNSVSGKQRHLLPSQAISVMKFVSLHHHSTYSYLDGFGTPDAHVKRATELGYGAMALTEHGNVSSHFRFEKAAKAAGIKPIFGLEAYTAAT